MITRTINSSMLTYIKKNQSEFNCYNLGECILNKFDIRECELWRPI